VNIKHQIFPLLLEILLLHIFNIQLYFQLINLEFNKSIIKNTSQHTHIFDFVTTRVGHDLQEDMSARVGIFSAYFFVRGISHVVSE
jgi:hypothetical protein